MKMNPTCMAAAVLAILMNSGATAQGLSEDWEVFANADDSFMAVHKPSIQDAGSQVTGWVLINYMTAQGKPPGTFRSIKTKYSVDCGKRRLASSQSTSYSKLNGAGDVVRSGEVRLSTFEDAIPETMGEAVVERLCQRRAPVRPKDSDDTAKLNAVFPGWAEFVVSQGFRDWLKRQPTEFQRMCNETGEATQFIQCINGYRVHSGLPKLALQ